MGISIDFNLDEAAKAAIDERIKQIKEMAGGISASIKELLADETIRTTDKLAILAAVMERLSNASGHIDLEAAAQLPALPSGKAPMALGAVQADALPGGSGMQLSDAEKLFVEKLRELHDKDVDQTHALARLIVAMLNDDISLEFDGTDSRLERANRAVDTLEEQLRNKGKDTSALQAEVARLKRERDTALAGQADLRKQLDAANAKASSLQNDLNDAASQAASAGDAIQRKEREITAAKSEAAKAKERAEEATRKLASLKNSLINLKDGLSDGKGITVNETNPAKLINKTALIRALENAHIPREEDARAISQALANLPNERHQPILIYTNGAVEEIVAILDSMDRVAGGPTPNSMPAGGRYGRNSQ